MLRAVEFHGTLDVDALRTGNPKPLLVSLSKFSSIPLHPRYVISNSGSITPLWITPLAFEATSYWLNLFVYHLQWVSDLNLGTKLECFDFIRSSSIIITLIRFFRIKGITYYCDIVVHGSQPARQLKFPVKWGCWTLHEPSWLAWNFPLFFIWDWFSGMPATNGASCHAMGIWTFGHDYLITWTFLVWSWGVILFPKLTYVNNILLLYFILLQMAVHQSLRVGFHSNVICATYS